MNNNIDQQLIKDQYSPVFASLSWDPSEDTEEAKLKWYGIFLKLPLSIRFGLINSKTKKLVEALTIKYNISDINKVGEVSRIIRELFVRKIPDFQLRTRIKTNLNISENQQNNFISDLNQVVNQIKSIGDAELDSSRKELEILAVLKNYPKIGEQLVTTNYIKLKMFNQPVRPSVNNWLEDYFSHVGTGKHSSMDRSDYLFNSENGRKLTSTEREKVGIILKSYDEGSKLVVDVENQEILFFEAARDDSPRVNLAEGQMKAKNEIKPRENSFSKAENTKPVVANGPIANFKNQNSQNVASSNIIKLEEKKKKEEPPKNLVDLTKYL